MAILENRLTLTEDRIATVIAHTRGLGEIPVTSPSRLKTTMYSECTDTPEKYLRSPGGFPTGNMNMTSVSAITQGQSMYQSQGQGLGQGQLFDDRSYDDLNISNARNQSKVNMNVKSNSWMNPNALQELQDNDEYVREGKRHSADTGSDYGVEGKAGDYDGGEEYEEEEGENNEPIEVGHYDVAGDEDEEEGGDEGEGEGDDSFINDDEENQGKARRAAQQME